MLSARIFMYMGRTHSYTIASNKKVIRLLMPRLRSFERETTVSGPRWSCDQYWNFAAARRELWSQWSQWSDQCPTEVTSSCTDTCWHRDTCPLLGRIQKLAYGEIRANTMLTIGTKLPPELTERIFEFAMAAEDAPLDPEIYIEVEEPLKEENVADRFLPKMERLLRVRERYRCTNMSLRPMWCLMRANRKGMRSTSVQ